ncbi:NAD(P)-binding domain-containing protein [Chloroflexota bacterium]
MKNLTIGFIGFGEVGYHLALGFEEEGLRDKVAYCRGQRNKPPYSEQFRQRAKNVGVELADTLKELIEKCDLLFSCVTGEVGLKVAKQVAPLLDSRKMYVDCNNSAPQDKEMAALAINARGGRFVDAALVGPPLVKKHKTPFLVSGDGAGEFQELMIPYGMDIEIIPGKAGTAAMLKTIWQVYTKGLQGLLWETILAAEKAGVDLVAHPHPPVKFGSETINVTLSDYLICHGGIHAARKADELKLAAGVLRNLGIEPMVAEAASKRLAKVAEFNLKKHFDGEIPSAGYRAMIEVIKRTGTDVT